MIEVKNLYIKLGDFALEHVNLTANKGECLVLLGPSGGGKTTLIECIAGLHRPASGRILLDGQDITSLPPEKRGVGWVPQDYGLFPHLTVAENIAFGLKARRHSPQQTKDRVEYLASLVKIPQLFHRYPHNLSGGEKQRVALARALAPSPKVLLLDEPLSSLDIRSSKHLRTELRWLQKHLSITTIWVTHDLLEAEEMADRIAILQHGRLEQVALPQELLFHPANDTVSELIGEPNILDCQYSKVLGQGLMEVGCGGVPIVVAHEADRIHKIAFFPRDIYVSAARPPGPSVNHFQATVTEIVDSAATVRLRVKLGGNSLLAELPRDIFEEMAIKLGQEVFLILRLRWIRAYSGN